MLNIAGPDYDFSTVVFAVLQECEHRRRGLDPENLALELREVARDKLSEIKAAYDEAGGSPKYWEALDQEVMSTVMPQYTQAASEMTQNERDGFGIWRNGDLTARVAFTFGGLFLGGLIIVTPFIPIAENIFTFLLAGGGFVFPDLKRYVHERKHAKQLNRLIQESAYYQHNRQLQYMTTSDFRESFPLAAPRLLGDEEQPVTPRESTTERLSS